MKPSKIIFVLAIVLHAAIINCKGTGVIISSGGQHGAIDCTGPSILMQVDNPNPNYDYHWHYVLFDTTLGNCGFDNWSNLIGYGGSIYVPTNMSNFFAIVCYADSAGMLWDDSHWFKVRNSTLKAPVCVNPFSGPCGERYVSISPQVFYVDSNYTFINLQWMKNGVPFNPAGPNVPFDVTLNSSGYYCLRAQVGNCGYAYSDSIHVVINKPIPVITPSGPMTFCSGGNVMLQVNTGSGATYQWKKNGTNISGATAASYTANSSGNYKVIKTNAQGCSGTSAVAAVTVNNNPSVTITAQGPTTFCLGDSVQLKTSYNNSWSYQWKRNNLNISGATSHKIYAKTAGNYKVKVTNLNGCTNISAPVAVSVPCRENEVISSENKFTVEVFPNPSSGDFIFEIEKTMEEKISITVADVLGKIVLSETDIDSRFTIHKTQLVPGIYSAIVTVGENRRVLRIVKAAE